MNAPLHTPRHLSLPLTADVVRTLRAGDRVALSGVLYTARDAAHKRIVAALAAGLEPPMDLDGCTLYYTGPTPAPPGHVVGSIGPTTAGRMDAFTGPLLAHGLRAMVGKGLRGPDVAEALKRHTAVYFAAVGGAGALLAGHVRSCTVAAYADLGAEAVHRLEVDHFPVIVAQDCHGGSVFSR